MYHIHRTSMAKEVDSQKKAPIAKAGSTMASKTKPLQHPKRRLTEITPFLFLKRGGKYTLGFTTKL